MYADPKNITVEELAKLLKAIPELKAWISAIEDYALSIAQEGIDIPGFEVGLTRPSRIWTDENAVIDILQSSHLELDKYMPRSLLSVAQMEKLLGKKEFTSNLQSEVGSTTGNPKLVAKA